MKLLFLLAAIGLIAAASASKPPRDQCFVKSTKCCYKFAKCGYVFKHVPVSKRCDFHKCARKCHKVCKHVCRYIKVKVPVKHCKPVTKKICKPVRGKGKHRKHYYKCYYKVVGKKCYKKYVYKKKKVCERKCHVVCKKVCYTIKANCHSTRTYKFAKFCPKLVCNRPMVTGDSTKPHPYVSSRKVFVSETKPIKKIIGKMRK